LLLAQPESRIAEWRRAEKMQMEAKELIRRGYDAFNAHDVERFMSFLQEGFSAETGGPDAFSGPQLAEFDRAQIRAFPDARWRLVNLIAEGDTVCAEHVFEGTHTGVLITPMGEIQPTGKRVANRVAWIAGVRDGKLTWARIYSDRLTVMEQLGLMGRRGR
jgi:predicted ester cyclase